MKKQPRILAALVAALLLAGCGSSTGSRDGGYYSENAAYSEASSQDAAAAGGAQSTLVPEDLAESAATDETAQKIVYNADLSMESTDFNAARDALLAAADANDAWLEYSSVSGTEKDHDRYAYFTVRVPVENYRAFLSDVGEAGSVLNLSESAQNITSNYIDAQARLSALEAQRDRLNELADQAETTADLLEIESQLSDVQYQLESYTQQLRNMDTQVSYSTVDISLNEVATLTPTGTSFGEKIADAFKGGWHGFVVFVQGLILVLIYLWPVLVLGGAIALLVVFLVKRHRKKHPKAPKAPKAAGPSPAPQPAPAQPQNNGEPKPKY